MKLVLKAYDSYTRARLGLELAASEGSVVNRSNMDDIKDGPLGQVRTLHRDFRSREQAFSSCVQGMQFDQVIFDSQGVFDGALINYLLTRAIKKDWDSVGVK